ncbi:MAG TPA: 3-hydroxyacyl-ACP dehydratase FabZ family protein [Chitinivibrionales bacterium]
MPNTVLYDTQAICRHLPHRPPFLFVDRVLELVPHVSITAERDIKSDEFFFIGHFPGKPIMPGVLITDALAQTSGLLWGLSKTALQAPPADKPELFFLAAADMKFITPAYPGETLRLMARSVKNFGGLFNYAVEAFAGRKHIAKGSLTLAMMRESV